MRSGRISAHQLLADYECDLLVTLASCTRVSFASCILPCCVPPHALMKILQGVDWEPLLAAFKSVHLIRAYQNTSPVSETQPQAPPAASVLRRNSYAGLGGAPTARHLSHSQK